MNSMISFRYSPLCFAYSVFWNSYSSLSLLVTGWPAYFATFFSQTTQEYLIFLLLILVNLAFGLPECDGGRNWSLDQRVHFGLLLGHRHNDYSGLRRHYSKNLGHQIIRYRYDDYSRNLFWLRDEQGSLHLLRYWAI